MFGGFIADFIFSQVQGRRDSPPTVEHFSIIGEASHYKVINGITQFFLVLLPTQSAEQLFLFQRAGHADINDFEICNKYDIDNTGLVCSWPSEDVLAYCLFYRILPVQGNSASP